MKSQLKNVWEDIISLDNFLGAWREFICGKRARRDVQDFSVSFMDNILSLRDDLAKHTYKHGDYQAFCVDDPKPRIIHKASVRDRLLHRAIYRVLSPFFDRTFIADSFSCRLNKGTHKAINKFAAAVYKVSKNDTKACWVLKCDIKRFFHSIDHDILVKILAEYVPDQEILALLKSVISSFSFNAINTGLPLGNLTSQLFANIYLNRLDQFVKHRVKAQCYIRYADDFVILSENKDDLMRKLSLMGEFLRKELRLVLHSDKVSIKKLSSGIDFLGMVNFFHFRVLRTKTKRRMFRVMAEKYLNVRRGLLSGETFNQGLQAYFGILKHCNGHKEFLSLLRKYDKIIV
ncbi:group II intron reverse transcriptase domain-containing protein [Candidatus Falkowbacteria bacterium]|nr:group II intron reverse transcriptase domain-containing protein [Candidatus Falkowbacteria bacterium]